MAQTKYTYSIATDTVNGVLIANQLTTEIQAQGSGVNTTVDSIASLGDVLDIYMADILPDDIAGTSASLAAVVALHDGIQIDIPARITLAETKNADGLVKFQPGKSYRDTSKSFTSPDYCNRQSWWFDTTSVVDEVLTNAGDDLNYTSTRTPTSGWDHDWINWKKIPNNARQIPGNTFKVVVKKNDVVVTSGFIIDYTLGKVTFNSANSGSDVIKVSYRYANSSLFELSPTTGKILRVDYIEVQFSKGCVLPVDCYVIFEAVYNGPALPANSLYAGFPGYPANTDLTLKTYEYHSGADFMNEATIAHICHEFMEFTKPINILPWNYLTGHTLKPPGDATTNIANNEFNKLRMRLVKDGAPDPIVTSCEIATGTVYAMTENLS